MLGEGGRMCVDAYGRVMGALWGSGVDEGVMGRMEVDADERECGRRGRGGYGRRN